MKFGGTLFLLLLASLQWLPLTTSESPLVLDTTFMKTLINCSVAHFNRIAHRFVSDARSYAFFDILDFSSRLDYGVMYNLTAVLAEISCSGLRVDPYDVPNLATCAHFNNSTRNLITKFYEVTFKVLYKPWLSGFETFEINVTSARAKPGSEVRLPKYPEFLGFRLPKDSLVQFDQFISNYNKHYLPDERSMRYQIFKKNLLNIELISVLDRSAQYGVTSLADLSDEEFRRSLANMKMPSTRYSTFVHTNGNVPKKDAPSKFDWRTLGAVTKVKNQGMCGSCWAFAATGNIEGQWFKKTRRLISLSEQQLLDCDSKDQACNGGYPEWAYDSIAKMGGLMSEEDYPYEAMQEKTCQLKKQNISAYINGSANLTTDEKELAAWLAENGPVSVGVNAMFLQFYFGGISHPPHILCPKEGMDHAVLLVGYDTSRFLRRPYWIVKNSWGIHWGEKGYFRMYRGDGTCGINADPTTSVVS